MTIDNNVHFCYFGICFLAVVWFIALIFVDQNKFFIDKKLKIKNALE